MSENVRIEDTACGKCWRLKAGSCVNGHREGKILDFVYNPKTFGLGCYKRVNII